MGVLFLNRIYLIYKHLILKILTLSTDSDDKPPSLAECVADTIDCDLTARQYKKIARRHNRKGHRVFHSYSKVADYKHKKCTPKGIKSPTEHSIEVDIEDVLHHQTSKYLTPEIKEKMLLLKAQGATFVLYYKYGKITSS